MECKLRIKVHPTPQTPMTPKNTLQWRACVVALILACVPAIITAAPCNILQEIEGDTHCVESALRHYYMWARYDGVLADLVNREQDHSQEATWWEAGEERPTL